MDWYQLHGSQSSRLHYNSQAPTRRYHTRTHPGKTTGSDLVARTWKLSNHDNHVRPYHVRWTIISWTGMPAVDHGLVVSFGNVVAGGLETEQGK
jgi:hypothetical protein